MANIVIAPTLHTMQDIYQLSREGGPASERFRTYVKRVEHEWGLVAYNPMAGEAALETTTQLLAVNAEAVALDVAREVATLLQATEPITLAVVVRSKGLWTDRIATEIDERISDKCARNLHGLVSIWSREVFQLEDVQREAAAETVRVLYTARQGVAESMRQIFVREGLAYALAARFSRIAPLATGLADTDRALVQTAFELLGDSTLQSDIVGVLYGDPVAEAMGWTTLGIPEHAGYRYAVEMMRDVTTV